MQGPGGAAGEVGIAAAYFYFFLQIAYIVLISRVRAREQAAVAARGTHAVLSLNINSSVPRLVDKFAWSVCRGDGGSTANGGNGGGSFYALHPVLKTPAVIKIYVSRLWRPWWCWRQLPGRRRCDGCRVRI